MSPVLFNIAISDITKIITSTSVTMYAYADDIALASDNREELQATLGELQKYTDANSLLVNESKTVLMIFRKGGNHG